MNPLIKQYGRESRWVNWALQKRDGKETKVPYYTKGKTRRMASSTDPETWTTYTEAKEHDERVGIVLHNKKLCVFDIDHCLDEHGVIAHKEKAKILLLLAQTDTYTEISPSKSGLHIYLAVDEPLTLTASKRAPFEVYTTGRYLTVTETPFNTTKPIRTIPAEEALALIEAIVPQEKDAPARAPSPVVASTDLPRVPVQPTLLEKMFNADNGSKVRALYDGDITAYDGDASRADAALLAHFAFWSNKNEALMEEWWVNSPLGRREKTQKRKDYRRRSIAAAIRSCKNTYVPPETLTEDSIPARETLPIDELNLLFRVKDRQRVYYKNTENMTRVLKKHPDFKGTLRFDDFKGIIERRINGAWRSLEDHDAIDIQTRISVLFPDFAHVSKDMVYDAMIKAAYDEKIDSGADYIRSLTWDGITRLETWLHCAYHTPKDTYHAAVGSNWLKGLVRRVIEPGCKFDYVLVLEGKQGIRKSTSLGVLAGVLGRAETFISSDQKDFFLVMQGHAIIEFSEGETLSRAEVKQLKSVITTAVDEYRQPYGRAVVPHPRRCVFAMTTNQTEYLKDETGNRRWLPVAVEGNIDIPWLEENREQLLAEAYARVVKSKETTWEFPLEEMEDAQRQRRVTDPNSDAILNWYWAQTPSHRAGGVTISEIYQYALCGGFLTKPMKRVDEMSIADVLRTWLKLEAKRVMLGGKRSYRYFPTDRTESTAPPVDVPVLSEVTF